MNKKLTDALWIRNKKIKNRICVPPMVCFNYSDESGIVSEKHINHYQQLAKNNAGLIIVEATCVEKDGKLADSQLGLYCDEQKDGMKKLVQAIHKYDVPAILQLHHAGVVGISEKPLCPSEYHYKNVVGKEMSEKDIHYLQSCFIKAAIRAYEVGYDGIELHACHSYLLSQIFNSKVNKRQDSYKNPINFIEPIITTIRQQTDENFIIGIRLGGYEPDLDAGISHAKQLDCIGVDYLSISYGFKTEEERPQEYDISPIFDAAFQIKKEVTTLVFGVGGITSKQIAQNILEKTNLDMICVGRAILKDPKWINNNIY